MAAEQWQQTVEFSTLVTRAAQDSYGFFKELVDKFRSTELSDTDKKDCILRFLDNTQQRMLRLNFLSNWCQQVPVIQRCQQIASIVSNHDMSFTQAADSLLSMHKGLQQAGAPFYDVPSAVEILLFRSYLRLPKCIEDMGTQYAFTEDQQKVALKKLDMLVRSKLLEASLPNEISDIKVSDGTALIRVDGAFKVLVTLGYRGHLSLWRILHLALLVGEKNRPVKLEELQRHVLGDDLERRMAAAEKPFLILYLVLHELCVSLVMDTVIRQVQALQQGRWNDAIRLKLETEGSKGHEASSSCVQNPDGESDSSGLRTPGLKIIYWLCFDKNAGACPFIKIEPGSDLQITCLHSNFVIDPLTGKEAEFYLDQSCIDVERLLLRAICCSSYTRLLEIKRELVKNIQVCRTADDVVLQSRMGELDIEYKQDEKGCGKDSEGHEALRVRAYGCYFFTLGIHIRNGRFLLQSSQNIVASSALLECAKALNQGSMTAADVFISLRSNSILHLFASIGRVLGLEVFEHGFNTVKIPKNVSNGSAMLMMGFPDCGSSYFLLMQLDKDFKPLFKLLETRPDPSSKDNLFGDFNRVLRFKKIDLEQMQVFEDELNVSLVDWGKVRSFLPHAACPNQTSGCEIFSDICPESSTQIARGHPPGASSLVDEGPGLEKGSSSSLNTSVPSHYGSVPMNVPSSKARTPSPKLEGAQALESTVNDSTGGDVMSKHDKKPQKRTASDMSNLIPSLQGLENNPGICKRRKISDSSASQLSSPHGVTSTEMKTKPEGYSYGSLIAEANKGNAPSSIYISALLHVVRHCLLCIKQARLTSHMDALDIPYVEVGLRNIWFRPPYARDDSWKHICLRLGRPGCMYWDVKINEQRLIDLWELQKGSSNIAWRSGVRIADTSVVDTHVDFLLVFSKPPIRTFVFGCSSGAEF